MTIAELKAANILPTSLDEIRACAASTLEQPGVVSVVVQATWGACEVLKDGTCREPRAE